MPNIGIQPVHLFNDANLNVYNGTVLRDVEVYAYTIPGQQQLETDVAAGKFTITVDNGAIISPGTIPPLTRPQPPASVAFSQKIEAETMQGNTGSITFEGTTVVGPFASSSDQRTATLSVVGTNPVTVTYKYQTNGSTAGHGSYSINGGSAVEFPVEGTDGGTRTPNFTFIPLDGANTIRFEGKDGTSFFLDYIIVSRTA